ncbi:MAG: metal-dependent hydrolase [Aquabacterium sp.]
MTHAAHAETDSLTVRHLDVDLSNGFPVYWNNNDAYRSQLLNALSFLFPVGEQYFIDSVRHFAKQIEAQGDTRLSQEIRLFIGQEATHRHLHQQYNDVLVSKGYKPWAAQAMARAIHRARHMSAKVKLAATVGYEHYTAILGDGLLRHPSWSEGMFPTMRALWMWHAAEESEHKAVAMDTFNAVGGSYRLRIGVFAFITFEFMFYAVVQSTMMLWQDRQLLRPRTWASALSWWWGREGLIWHTLPHWLAYLKPGFHPWQHDNRDLLARWRRDFANGYKPLNTQPTRHPA